MMQKRESYRRDSFETSFHHSTHSAGIRYVHRRVRTMVDAGKDEIRTTGNYCMECELYAVDRRAVDCEKAHALRCGRDFVDTERRADCECGRLSRMGMCGGDYEDIAECAEYIGQMMYARSIDAVVVRNKY